MRSGFARVFSYQRVETDDEPVVLGKSDPKEEPVRSDFDYIEGNDEVENEAEDEAVETDNGEADSIKNNESIIIAANELISSNTREICDNLIAQATAEAARIIDEAHEKAQEEYNIALQNAADSIKKEREQAQKLGRAEAAEQYRDEVIDCITKVEELICRLESDHAAFITGYENDLKWLAIEIAQQILADTIERDNQKLCSLVMAAVRSAKSARWMKVELSDKMADILSTLQNAVETEMPGKVQFELVSAPPEHCVVETPEKVFDASFTQQIENLKIYFANEQGV